MRLLCLLGLVVWVCYIDWMLLLICVVLIVCGLLIVLVAWILYCVVYLRDDLVIIVVGVKFGMIR